MEAALQGVRILDLTRALAGPYGTMILADLGAEVIKIEAPGSRRELGGPFSYKGMDAYFIGVNRNKKSVTLNLTKPEGRQVFYDLVRVSDVVFDNFRPDVPKRLGIDYETLSQINPRIICASISGYGSRGPLREQPAYDLCIQAISGAVSITGDPAGPPVRNGIAVADQGAGLIAALAVIAALYARQQTGQGQKVETSLLESMLYQLAYEIALYTISGIVPGPMRSGHQMAQPYGIYQTTDGYLALAAPMRFKDMCEAIGQPQLTEDERFDKYEKLIVNRLELDRELEAVFRTRGTQEWLEVLTAADIPCAPVNTIDKAICHPQVEATEMMVSIPHVLGGEVRVVGIPIQMSATATPLRSSYTSPPVLGQHTEELLSQLLGYGQERIQELRALEVIASAKGGPASGG